MIDRAKALEVWKSIDGSWTWYVMEKNEPHRWFCLVTSPYVGPEGELGNVYDTDITSNATLVR